MEYDPLHDPVHIYLPNSPDDDPRLVEDPPEGIIVHRGPPLHPDDQSIVNGIPCTSPSRTLIDMAEVVGSADELRELFLAARERGLLDPARLAAARLRVEWRPSLALFDEVAADFVGSDTI